VPKAKPIIEHVNGVLACRSIQVPPRSNGSILKIKFLQTCGFLVVITEGFLLIMEGHKHAKVGQLVILGQKLEVGDNKLCIFEF
jgi:hypothetical protein